MVQTVLFSKGWLSWNKPTKNSDDMESFEKWFIRNFGESTVNALSFFNRKMDYFFFMKIEEIVRAVSSFFL
jgi:protoporphyrinogen oxidase